MRDLVARAGIAGIQTFFLLCIAIGFVCVAPTTGSAMVPDLPEMAKERGVKAGAFRLWPRLALEGGYDTNVFYAANNDSYQKVGAPLLLVSPGLRLENPDGRDIRISLDSAGAFRRYLSGDKTVDDPQSNFGFDSTLILSVFPERMASFEVYDVFSHRLETPNFSTTKTFNRVVNKAGTRIRLHPGGVGGRKALELSFGYAYELEKFVDFDRLDQSQHTFNALGLWRFFPKTLFFVDTVFGLRSWDAPNPQLGRTNSQPLRVYSGISGFITKKVSATARMGYGSSSYEEGEDFTGFVGEASIAYSPQRTTILSFAYARDFKDSLYANFYSYDRVSTKIKQQFVERFNLHTELSYSLVDFAPYDPAAGGPTFDGIFQVANTTDRNDAALESVSGLEFEVTRYFAFQLSYRFRQVFSEFEERSSQDNILSTDDEIIDVGGYDRHLFLGGVRVQY